MKKRCQIHAVFPITCFTVPIVGRTELNLTHDEIYKCLCSKAEVSEILPSGKLVRLDFTNYNKDNDIKKAVVEEPIVKEEEKEDIVEETPTEEEVVVESKDIPAVTNGTVIIDEPNVTESVTVSAKTEDAAPLTKTHEISSRNTNRNNNYNKNNNYKKVKNNNR